MQPYVQAARRCGSLAESGFAGPTAAGTVDVKLSVFPFTSEPDMADLLTQALPILAIAGLAALVVASARSAARHDRAVREIRASLDETERRLEELGWLERSAPQTEEDA